MSSWTIVTNERNGNVVFVSQVTDDHELIITTEHGMTVRIPVRDIREQGRNTMGVRIMRLNEGDKVVSVTQVIAEIGQEEHNAEAIEQMPIGMVEEQPTKEAPVPPVVEKKEPTKEPTPEPEEAEKQKKPVATPVKTKKPEKKPTKATRPVKIKKVKFKKVQEKKPAKQKKPVKTKKPAKTKKTKAKPVKKTKKQTSKKPKTTKVKKTKAKKPVAKKTAAKKKPKRKK